MSIENVWKSVTLDHQRHDLQHKSSADLFVHALDDATQELPKERVFQAKSPHRDNQFPETPKTAIGLDGQKKFSSPESFITMLNSQFPSSKFEALFFGQNQFGDLGAKQLATVLQHNQSIKHLILPHNQLSNFAIAALADMLKVNHHIGWLVLNNNQIGNDGATALADALEVNQGVKHLILADNQIEDDGVIAIADALKRNRSVQSLCIQGNPFGDEGLRALISLCQHSTTLQKLDCRDIKDFSPNLLRQLSDICKAKKICFAS